MRKNVLVLGGVHAHQELIIQLKGRGFYVILIDYNEMPPAQEFADEHIKESILDKELIGSIIEEREIYAIFSSNLDIALPVIAELSKKFDLPFYLDYEKSLLVTDKLKMKNIFNLNGIPTSKWVTKNKINNVNEIDLKYPLIIKPVNGTGSKGLQKVLEKNKLIQCFNASKDTSSGDVLIEEFYEGKEYSLDAFAFSESVQLFTIRERLKVEINQTNSMVCVGALIINNFLSNKTLIKMEEIVNNIANAFQLKNMPLMVQLIQGVDSKLNVIEIAARNSGGIAHTINKKVTGFDIISATIDSILQKPLMSFENKDLIDNDLYMNAIIYASGGRISKFVGFDEIKNKGIITDYRKIRNEGDKLPEKMSVKNRVMEVTIIADDYNELKEKSNKLYNEIDILDSENISILDHNVSILNCI